MQMWSIWLHFLLSGEFHVSLCIFFCWNMAPPMTSQFSRHISANRSPLLFLSPTPSFHEWFITGIVRSNICIEILHDDKDVIPRCYVYLLLQYLIEKVFVLLRSLFCWCITLDCCCLHKPREELTGSHSNNLSIHDDAYSFLILAILPTWVAHSLSRVECHHAWFRWPQVCSHYTSPSPSQSVQYGLFRTLCEHSTLPL